MKIYQVILRGAESCGKGVRFRVLSATEVDKVTIDAAASLDVGTAGVAAQIALMSASKNLGIRRMLVAITKGPVTPSGEDPKTKKPVYPTLSDDALWNKVDSTLYASLSSDGWDSAFSASDSAMLAHAYTKLHALTGEAVEDMMGEALEIATD